MAYVVVQVPADAEVDDVYRLFVSEEDMCASNFEVNCFTHQYYAVQMTVVKGFNFPLNMLLLAIFGLISVGFMYFMIIGFGSGSSPALSL